MVLAVLRQSGLAQMVDLTFYDLIISRKAAPSGLDSPITLIGIEERDIQRYGWPIDSAAASTACAAVVPAPLASISTVIRASARNNSAFGIDSATNPRWCRFSTW